MSETNHRTLEEPLIEDYPVDYEKIVRKLDQVEPFLAHYEDDSGETSISTAFIPGDGISNETIIVNVPWSDSADIDVNLVRHVALAEHTGADVIIIGFPGYNKANNDKLTPHQKNELMHKTEPSFGEVGKALASAVDQISRAPEVEEIGPDYWKGRSTTLSGYSQASMSELGMFLHLEEHIAKSVDRLILWENPDPLSPQALKSVVGNFMEDAGKGGDAAFQKNELVFGRKEAKELGIHDKGTLGQLQFIRMALVKNLRLYPALKAIAGSTTERDIKILNKEGRLDGVHIDIINNEKSLVDPTEQANKLMRMLVKQVPKSGEKTHTVLKKAYHSTQNSIMDYTFSAKDVLNK